MAYTYRISGDDTILTVKHSKSVQTQLTHGTIPTVAVTAQKLEYTHIYSEFMFAGSGETGQTIGQIYTYSLPSNWQVVSF